MPPALSICVLLSRMLEAVVYDACSDQQVLRVELLREGPLIAARMRAQFVVAAKQRPMKFAVRRSADRFAASRCSRCSRRDARTRCEPKFF